MAENQPVFILSLPRSGSTLLQRMLMANPADASAPEPWLLLPLLYARRKFGDRSFAVNHESPVAEPASQLARVRDYLGLGGSQRGKILF